VLLKNSGN
jgi:hypothetical protein